MKTNISTDLFTYGWCTTLDWLPGQRTRCLLSPQAEIGFILFLVKWGLHNDFQRVLRWQLRHSLIFWGHTCSQCTKCQALSERKKNYAWQCSITFNEETNLNKMDYNNSITLFKQLKTCGVFWRGRFTLANVSL